MTSIPSETPLKNSSHIDFIVMHNFNDFVFNANISEMPSTGRKFTLSNSNGSKLTKLDRIFASVKFLESWPNSFRELSDHCSLILKDVPFDFGPILFKIFNS